MTKPDSQITLDGAGLSLPMERTAVAALPASGLALDRVFLPAKPDAFDQLHRSTALLARHALGQPLSALRGRCAPYRVLHFLSLSGQG